TVGGPAGAGWGLDTLSVPVPAGAAVGGLVTPAGWSATYTPGAAAVVWQAASPASALVSGQQAVFGSSAAVPPGSATATVTATNAQTGERLQQTVRAPGPVAPGGPAVDDFYSLNAGASLAPAAASGLLANDRGAGLTVTAADAASAWGVPVQVAADGSFSYAPGARFRGLGAGETVTDRFHYTARDGLGNISQATVEVTIRGLNDAPVAADDPATPLR